MAKEVDVVDREATDAIRDLTRQLKSVNEYAQDVKSVKEDVNKIVTSIAVLETSHTNLCKQVDENKAKIANHEKEHAKASGNSLDRWAMASVAIIASIISSVVTLIGMMFGGN